ncbi:MAG: hypothetical protein KKE44_02850 [Proteobacteria bacterium]|nr:hypothetical protein [Pseudomonadota bacterium]MBU1581665.1 hypothetical protein [Pseudomonadota bacterium]MBU2455634.1 hypothetical protein [Pseudomonadota bacterium]MBU2629707.1 hypothetical protein [Pseudomonadota bacterium]
MKIFLSVGATYNEQQERFVSAFETFLGQNGCERLTVGRGNYYANQPVVAARDLMQSAEGVVVIAFTRQIIVEGIDKPDSEDEKKITHQRYPTVWNQIEAAMAFGLKLPLLMIIEEGVYQEAMLKDRLEYRALITQLDVKLFSSEEFRGIFSDWKRLAENRVNEIETTVDVKSLTIGKLIRELKPDQFWKVGVALFGLLAGIAGVAYWFGKVLNP